MQKDLLLEQLSQKIGQRIHQSEWLLITQDMINSFADATFDQQWICWTFIWAFWTSLTLVDFPAFWTFCLLLCLLCLYFGLEWTS